MNARAVKKRLMRRRVCNLWGRRAYLRVRLPLSVLPSLPPPPPSIPEGFEAGGWEGFWQKPDESESIHINKSSCGVDPSTLQQQPAHEQILFATFKGNRWEFWSGHFARQKGVDADGHPEYEFTPLDAELVAAQKAYVEWNDSIYDLGNGPVMDAFNNARNTAKSMNWSVDSKGITAEYGVKWFYADRKLHFCSDLSRALRIAKKHGVKARIVYE